jgi:hypothetical protein
VGWPGPYERTRCFLALLGIAAGAVVARSVRATEAGDRFVRGGSDMLGRSARELSSRVSDAASQAVEAVGDGRMRQGAHLAGSGPQLHQHQMTQRAPREPPPQGERAETVPTRAKTPSESVGAP